MVSDDIKSNPDSWVNSYADKLYAYVLSRVGSVEIAEDMVQETFLAGLKNLASFKGNSTEYTWLVSILKRKIIDFYRQKAARTTVSIDAEETRFKQSGSMKGHWLKEKGPKAWDNETTSKIENEEFMNILNYCIKMLPDKWASCFILRVVEEMPGSEVCKELNLSSSNLWTMLHRARLQLRDCLELNWINN